MVVFGFETDTAEICSQFAALPSICVCIFVFWWVVVLFFSLILLYTSADFPVFSDCPVAVLNVGANKMYICTILYCISVVHQRYCMVSGPVALFKCIWSGFLGIMLQHSGLNSSITFVSAGYSNELLVKSLSVKNECLRTTAKCSLHITS